MFESGESALIGEMCVGSDVLKSSSELTTWEVTVPMGTGCSLSLSDLLSFVNNYRVSTMKKKKKKGAGRNLIVHSVGL